MKLVDTVETYRHDRELFRKLGLKPFSYDTDEASDKHFVGEVKKDKSTCKVWVRCLPAQFWTFEIYCDESHATTTVQTGSGCLSDYWDMVEKIMDGMFVVTKVVTKGD